MVAPETRSNDERYQMKRALRVNTDFTTKILDLSENEYEQLRDSVGGLIEAVDLRPGLTIWVNEEGKLINLPFNVIGTHLWEKCFGVTDVIVGDCVFTGNSNDEGETEELSVPWVVQIQELAATLRKAYLGEATIVEV